jgi:hypothetical protein
MAETVHTFTKGMDLDTEKALRTNDVTYRVENFRLISNGDGTTGSLEVLRGNDYITTIVGLHRIVGHCLIRNYLILFGTYGFTPSISNVIYKLTLDENDNITDTEEIYSDDKNNDTGTLDFPSEGLKVVGRYESENIIKVYWTDNINPIRFINVAVYNTTNGLVYNGVTNKYVSPDKLEFLPNFLVTQIDSIEVKKGGSLKSGVIRYTYQFYNKNGSETTFAPLSDSVSITASSDSATSANKYKGSEVDINTGKSVEIKIIQDVTNVGFDYLKVIRVQYTTYGSLPIVDLIAEIEIEKFFSIASKTYTVIDNGNSLYNYTTEEVAVMGRSLFIAKDISTKDDLLFLGNLTEDFFDVDFDARTFRFPASSTSFYIRNNDIDETHTLAFDVESTWDTLLDTVGEDNDCINLYNDLTYDNKTTYSNNKYKCNYQYSSTTIGGTGRNIKYTFVTQDFVIDKNGASSKSGVNVQARTLEADLDIIITNNYSYTNYASPYMSMVYKGYQRGETYRFGIVFYDNKGRSSKVKWIGDIRFPSLKEAGYDGLVIPSISDDTLTSQILGIQFSVKNVPTEVVGWSIVRLKRTNLDKTIISQGVLSSLYYHSDSKYYVPLFPAVREEDYSYSAGTLKNAALVYISPDINYGTLDYRDGDYFETVGTFAGGYGYGTYATDNGTAGENVIKYNEFVLSNSTNLIYPTKVIYTSPGTTVAEYIIGGITVRGEVYHGTGNASFLGTCALFSYTGTLVYSSAAVGQPHSTTVVNLRRINNSQYGGNTYENRFTNEYISCGSIVNSTSACFTTETTFLDPIDIYGGDIFITMFERLHGIYYEGTHEACRVCYIPLESKYNLNLNSGFTYSRNASLETHVDLITETLGTHSSGSTVVLEQTSDFYIYNTAYSDEDSIIEYFSPSILDNLIVDYDTRVVVSNKKINNETVDNWTKFPANNFIDVDTSYGELSNLINFRNKLYYLQENGFGVLSVNERALVVDSNNPSGLILGSGGILDRYDYISTYYGNTNIDGVLSTESGIYWVDNNKSELVLFNGESLLPLSKAKRVDSFFKENYGTITNVKVCYDSKYNEALFKIVADTVDLNVLVFSELLNCFSSFYTIPVKRYIPLRSKLVSIYEGSVFDTLYEEDSINTTTGTFYRSGYDSTIQILHTEGFPTVKTYDNIEYTSTSKDSNGNNLYEDTFSTLQVYNDYQNTGDIPLVLNNNLRRRERNWTIAIPRNIVSADVSENVDIFDILNLDETLVYKERMRDNYSLIRLVYNNRNNFHIPFIKIKYRQSQR